MKIGTQSFLNSTNNSRTRQLNNLQVSIQRADNSDAATRSESSSQRVSAGAAFTASQAASSAQIASDATNSILDARQRQQSLIDQATISNDPARRQELQTAIDELDTEISRIAAETDGAGNNVLSARTFDITDSEIVALADLSSIASSSGVDVTTVAGAEAAETSIAQTITSTISGIEASASASRKADQVLSEQTSIEALARAERGAITEIDEATELSQTIANELSGTLGSAASSNLDPETVLQLIAD